MISEAIVSQSAFYLKWSVRETRDEIPARAGADLTSLAVLVYNVCRRIAVHRLARCSTAGRPGGCRGLLIPLSECEIWSRYRRALWRSFRAVHEKHQEYIRWAIPLSLALAGLLCVVIILAGPSAAGDTPPPPPSVQEARLWAAVGLNDAWYVTNGYTESPPPSASSPFWSESYAFDVVPTSDVSRPALDTQVGPREPQANQPGGLTTGASIDTEAPRLWLETNEVTFHANALVPGVSARKVEVRNAGGYTTHQRARPACHRLLPSL